MKKKIILVISSIAVGCSSWERGIKDFTSDISGGLDRTIEV